MMTSKKKMERPPVPPKPKKCINSNDAQRNNKSISILLQQLGEGIFSTELLRNCIKPRIFPMESTYCGEKVPTPFSSSIFASGDWLEKISQISIVVLKEKLKNKNYESSQQQLATVSYKNFNVSKIELFSSMSLEIFLMNLPPVDNSWRNKSMLRFDGMMSGGSLGSKKMSCSGGKADFSSALKKWSGSIPPLLSRKLGRISESPLGKVKVMLKVCENSEDASGTLGVDSRKKQVTLIDPGGTNNCVTPEERKVGVAAPKMFAFDGIFGDDDDQAEICAASAAELVASVVGGEDGCFVSLGSSTQGKKQTMFGKPVNQKMGVIPTTIYWLFKSIQEQKQKNGSKFSVRISALTVTGGSGHEVINDLLSQFNTESDSSPWALETNGQSVSGNKFSSSSSVLNYISEIKVHSVEKAGFYLDAAIDGMSSEDPVRHFIFTLHVYQSSADKKGVNGRSRLHFVTLGNGSPSISVLGGLLLAVLNGQRHLPSRDSKLGAILRECLGSLTCRAVVMIHVSNAHSRYAETLASLQLGSRVHRLRRSRRLKMGSVGSGTGSGGSSGGSGEEMRSNIHCSTLITNCSGGGTICEIEGGSSDIDPSSSEQSCDTVIYLGPSIDDATDNEHPPLYIPSLDSTTQNGCEQKILLTPKSSNCPIPPKAKSPKLKSSSSHHHHYPGPYNGNGTKGEEQWVDGPKMSLPKYLATPNKTHSSPLGVTKKSETWIDGPAASRIANQNHQGSNFPSPKKTFQPREPPCPSISSVKAQMIQEWISNQTSASLFEDSHLFNTTPYYNNSNYNYGNSSEKRESVGREYKALTVFKTCDDCECEEELSVEDFSNEFEFEFIEVVEPDIPVPTRDAWLQVTEEDIALSFLEENPLPESDQNFTMAVGDAYFYSSITPKSAKIQGVLNSNEMCENEFDALKNLKVSQPITASLLNKPDDSIQSSSPLYTGKNNDDHPLRILSQECLTINSTFSDSLSLKDEKIEKFWSGSKYGEESHISDIGMYHNHSLCKNMASLSQMSLNGEELGVSECIYNNGTNLNDLSLIAPLSQAKKEAIKNSEILQISSLLKPNPPAPPILSDESIFRIPVKKKSKKITSEPLSKDSESEVESILIPPMKLIDITPITNVPQTVVKDEKMRKGCDHNHSSPKKGREIGILNGNTGNFSPDVEELIISNGKSPNKSKSRKIAKFFRGRSKSPKIICSSSESGKSSGSSTISAETSKSSSSSSTSSNSKHNNNNKSINSIIHPTTTPVSSPKKNSKPPPSANDYHFNCDSVLPIFLPSCPTYEKNEKEVGIAKV